MRNKHPPPDYKTSGGGLAGRALVSTGIEGLLLSLGRKRRWRANISFGSSSPFFFLFLSISLLRPTEGKSIPPQPPTPSHPPLFIRSHHTHTHVSHPPKKVHTSRQQCPDYKTTTTRLERRKRRRRALLNEKREVYCIEIGVIGLGSNGRWWTAKKT